MPKIDVNNLSFQSDAHTIHRIKDDVRYQEKSEPIIKFKSTHGKNDPFEFSPGQESTVFNIGSQAKPKNNVELKGKTISGLHANIGYDEN